MFRTRTDATIEVKASVAPELFMTVGRALAIAILGGLLVYLLDTKMLLLIGGPLLTMTGVIGLVGGMFALWLWEVWQKIRAHRILRILAERAPDNVATVVK